MLTLRRLHCFCLRGCGSRSSSLYEGAAKLDPQCRDLVDLQRNEIFKTRGARLEVPRHDCIDYPLASALFAIANLRVEVEAGDRLLNPFLDLVGASHLLALAAVDDRRVTGKKRPQTIIVVLVLHPEKGGDRVR